MPRLGGALGAISQNMLRQGGNHPLLGGGGGQVGPSPEQAMGAGNADMAMIMRVIQKLMAEQQQQAPDPMAAIIQALNRVR